MKSSTEIIEIGNAYVKKIEREDTTHAFDDYVNWYLDGQKELKNMEQFIESDEQKFYRLVRTSTPYGRYHAANITWKGYDYFDEAHIDDGAQVAKDRLFEQLKKSGLIKTFI